MENNATLFLTVNKTNYKALLGIQSDNPDYYKIAFIDDGSGIITRGQLYVNSPYWLKMVDELPAEQEENTIYLIKE